MEGRSNDEGGDEKDEGQNMRTMYNQDLEMKDYMKEGTLYSARRTWKVRTEESHVGRGWKLSEQQQVQGLYICGGARPATWR